ncbi:unnamed protein product [Bursaphelenchus xylophilus]|uniref:(pine wood nematode) hypothetical protein n=1 Tax=Bursaphelenchus xylophilus TaxID=6326 RepID=A0A1I7SVD0_BURXY|nr:unnamed protein product [Bursaphelenchus xylophilus]CAG9101247.1 unnamed protein product [Bursaphelenchus xylophilus]
MNELLLNSTVDYEYEVNQEPPYSNVLVFGMAFGYILYAVAILFGIPCNVFVLYRMTKLAMKSQEVYTNGTGICLLAMSIADLVSLCSICVHYVLSFDINIGPFPRTVVCKIAIFSTHVSTSISIWSWLLMSTLRYLSVYHPLFHYRLWRLPVRVLLVILCGASLTNFALLFMVVYKPEEGCTLSALFPSMPNLNRVFLCLEIIWSFCIPTAIILFVDSSVYMCRRRYAVLSQYAQRSSHGLKKPKSSMWRWLIIALIDVVLNTPENIFRLSVILGLVDQASMGEMYMLGRTFSQVLYYFQFGFNGVYLALFIYDKSTKVISSARGSDKTGKNAGSTRKCVVSFDNAITKH